MTTPNIPLLRKLVEWVEEQESRGGDSAWNQGFWAIQRLCGTTYCAAGFVASLAGWTPIFDGKFVAGGATLFQKNGRLREAYDISSELLGLNDTQAMRLFYASTDAFRLRNICEEIAGERL